MTSPYFAVPGAAVKETHGASFKASSQRSAANVIVIDDDDDDCGGDVAAAASHKIAHARGSHGFEDERVIDGDDLIFEAQACNSDIGLLHPAPAIQQQRRPEVTSQQVDESYAIRNVVAMADDAIFEVQAADIDASSASGMLSQGPVPRLSSALHVKTVHVGNAAAADERCTVCQDALASAETLGVVPSCGHAFCYECIAAWARITNHCCLCKAEFTELRRVRRSWGEAGAFDILVRAEPVASRRQRVPNNEAEDRAFAWNVAEAEDALGDFVVADGGGNSDDGEAALDVDGVGYNAVPAEDTEEDDDEDADVTACSCTVCHAATDADVLLLCDACDSPWHTYCLPVPLHSVPDGRWVCPPCDAMRKSVRDYVALSLAQFVAVRQQHLAAKRVARAAAAANETRYASPQRSSATSGGRAAAAVERGATAVTASEASQASHMWRAAPDVSNAAVWIGCEPTAYVPADIESAHPQLPKSRGFGSVDSEHGYDALSATDMVLPRKQDSHKRTRHYGIDAARSLRQRVSFSRHKAHRNASDADELSDARSADEKIDEDGLVVLGDASVASADSRASDRNEDAVVRNERSGVISPSDCDDFDSLGTSRFATTNARLRRRDRARARKARHAGTASSPTSCEDVKERRNNKVQKPRLRAVQMAATATAEYSSSQRELRQALPPFAGAALRAVTQLHARGGGVGPGSRRMAITLGARPVSQVAPQAALQRRSGSRVIDLDEDDDEFDSNDAPSDQSRRVSSAQQMRGVAPRSLLATVNDSIADFSATNHCSAGDNIECTAAPFRRRGNDQLASKRREKQACLVLPLCGVRV